MTINDRIQSFWQWLEMNRAELDILRHPSEPFWDRILEQLQRIADGIWFEMDSRSSPKELVFTAHGDVSAFPFIDALVSSAPHFSGWEFTALKPAAGLMTRYEDEDLRLFPDQFWFMRLRSRTDPSLLGLRIAIPSYHRDHAPKPYLRAAWRVVDGLLGERIASTRIQHLEVAEMPNEPQSEGYSPMRILPQVV